MTDATAFRRYPPVLQVLHWSIGLAVLCQLAIVLILGQLRSLEYGQFVLAMHRQMGFAILVLSVLRLAAILRHPAPPMDVALPAWQTRTARIVHGLFYVALLVQPVLGMLIAWARGDVVTAFGLFVLPAPWEISDAARDRFMTAHTATAVVLVLLVAVHLAAVVFNGWMRRVAVLERMLPGAPEDTLVNRVPVMAQLLAALGVVIVIALATGMNAVAKYRGFLDMTTHYQESDVAAAQETRLAQLSWKELVGMNGAALAGDRAHGIERGTREHLEAATQHGLNPDIAAGLQDLIKRLRDLESSHGAGDTSAGIPDIDSKLQELIDAEAAEDQQARGDLTEKASQGHDFIVVTIAPMALVGMILTLLLARSIAGSLGRLHALVRGIESDHGSTGIQVHGNGEFSALMRNMLGMRAAIEQRAKLAADQRLFLETERQRAEESRQADSRAAAERQAERDRQLQSQLERRQAAEQRALRERMAVEFESQVAGIVDAVATTIEALRSTAARLAQSAASTTRCSADASLVAESTRSSATVIAGSSDLLSETAKSVRRNAEQSKTRAVLGVEQASAARSEVDLLAVASREIGSISDLISDVTRQTNLLAVNARIEAARAGDLGRGFCIVADEVKTLAGKTRAATEEISGQVSQVATAATRSIEMIQNMRTIIADLESNSSRIFSACDDQSKSTEEIAAKVAQISTSTTAVATHIAEAERTARDTESMASDVVETAAQLRAQANALRKQVAAFVAQLRSINEDDGRAGVPIALAG